MALLHVVHRTRYLYPGPAVESHNEVRLQPLTCEVQRLRSFRLTLNPVASVFSYETPGGTVHHFGTRTPHRELDILAESVVETLCRDPFEGVNLLEDDAEWYARADTRARFAEYLAPSRFVPLTVRAVEMASGVAADGRCVAAWLIALNAHLFDLFNYREGVTDVSTDADAVLKACAGVCQDYAHAMIAICRSRGIPARYVSGYLNVPDDKHGLRGERATHAWVECPLPDGRWLGLDPTNHLVANDQYVRTHTGRDYGDAMPVRGVYTGYPAERLEVSVSVTEAARATEV